MVNDCEYLSIPVSFTIRAWHLGHIFPEELDRENNLLSHLDLI